MHRFLKHFCEAVYCKADGEYSLWAEFRADFLAYLEQRCPSERGKWPDKRIAKELRWDGYPVGRGPRNKRIVGNLSKSRTGRKWIEVRPGIVRLAKPGLKQIPPPWRA